MRGLHLQVQLQCLQVKVEIIIVIFQDAKDYCFILEVNEDGTVFRR
jgi:hypothetical protein